MIDPRHPNQEWVDRKRRARMERVDDLPKELRDLANDYGFHVVNSFMMVGVTSARHIRHLVEIVLDEFSPTRGTKSQQGIRTQVVQHLKNPEED